MQSPQHFRHELPGGVRLVGERVAGRRSLSLGIWIAVGSRDEDPGWEGAAHFVEHLVFKGSAKRSAREIAESLERVGGSLDAFTTKEATCFYARVLEEDVDIAVDVLCDLAGSPRFDSKDVDLERKVVMEELRSVEDAPEDLVGDLAYRHLWPSDVLGASILGTRESIQRLDSATISRFHNTHYAPARVVVSAAGAVDPEWLAASFTDRARFPGSRVPGSRTTPDPAHSVLAVHECDIAQLHLVLMSPAPAENDPRRHAVQLLADILGGGMSSRLFQTIREEAGLAYSVQSSAEHFEHAGIFSTALAVNPRRGEEAIHRTLEEMDRLVREGLSQGELDAAKAQVRGSMVMGLESLTSRMSRFARDELTKGRLETEEETLLEYQAVTEKQVLGAAEELFDPDRWSLVALGPVHSDRIRVKPFRSVVLDGVS